MIGAVTKEDIEDFKSCVRDGIMADIENNLDGGREDAPLVSRLLVVDVNDYEPADGEKWDVDKWEERQGYLYAPATRKNWKLLYGIARVLAQGKSATIRAMNGEFSLSLPTVAAIS